MFALLSTLTLALLGSAAAQFTITSPTSEIFWVSTVSGMVVISPVLDIESIVLPSCNYPIAYQISNSDNVVSWTGTSPAAQFTVL
jgi:hypothetical protein